MRVIGLPLFILTIFLWSCSSGGPSNGLTMVLDNRSDQAHVETLLHLPVADLKKAFPDNDLTELAPFLQDEPVPFQLNDTDQDGQYDQVALLASVPGNADRAVEWRVVEEVPTFPKRTQAELSHKVGGTWEDRKYIGGEFKNVSALRVPEEHTDHSYYIRYEGPGWESDKVGYRFYLDWRDAIDIFGKTTSEMVLQEVGQDGFDSYHELSDWGMDVLKVGESLGLGTFGKWMDGKAMRVAKTDSLHCAVVLDGPVESMVRTRYLGWAIGDHKLDLTSELSIAAGSRATRHDLTLSQPLDNLCTGIVKAPDTRLLQHSEGGWGYLATWGQQSLNNDLLGMAILYRTSDLVELTEDDHSHVVVLDPGGPQLSYYFLAAWEKEPDGITSEAQFEQYLKEELYQLNNPLEVRFAER